MSPSNAINFSNKQGLAERYLDLARQKLPTVNRVIQNYGDLPLSVYLKTLVFNPEPAYQSLDDLLEIVEQYATPLLGKPTAQSAAEALARCPVVLTANHHGVDYFSQSVQGNLIFALNKMLKKGSKNPIPIFSCGSIPLNNVTYPQGALLYHVDLNRSNHLPKKLPMFTNKNRRKLVSIVGPIDLPMVYRAQKQINKMYNKKMIPDGIADTLRHIINFDYGSETVQHLPDYSQQSVVLNSRIWKKFLGKDDDIPELVYLEIEKITEFLLKKDLTKPNSLAFQVLFNPALRGHVLDELEGLKVCWDTQKLQQRIAADSIKTKQTRNESCGTHFFWGISDLGRKIPLNLRSYDYGNFKLIGVDDHGNLWEHSYSPNSILKGLNERRLLPSLFTSYLVISLARGIICVGGYFQAEYLPNFQQGLVRALNKTDDFQRIAKIVDGVPTDTYLSGMATVMTQPEPGYLVPSGPVEIIAGGGIGKRDIEKMATITVRDAHLAAIMETVPDIIPSAALGSYWKRELASESYRLLAKKVIIK